MARDLRELFAKEREQNSHMMQDGHEERFLSKLEEKMPKKVTKGNSSISFWLQIAASVAVVLGLGVYFFSSSNGVDPNLNVEGVEQVDGNGQYQTISLGDLSPDLKKIENYYLTNIGLQLSDLEVDADNKEIMDSYMDRLAELDAEYHQLNVELNEMGPNDLTINALIKNLQLRLQLLQKLKTKLNQLKTSKNEQKSSQIV